MTSIQAMRSDLIRLARDGRQVQSGTEQLVETHERILLGSENDPEVSLPEIAASTATRARRLADELDLVAMMWDET